MDQWSKLGTKQLPMLYIPHPEASRPHEKPMGCLEAVTHENNTTPFFPQLWAQVPHHQEQQSTAQEAATVWSSYIEREGVEVGWGPDVHCIPPHGFFSPKCFFPQPNSDSRSDLSWMKGSQGEELQGRGSVLLSWTPLCCIKIHSKSFPPNPFFYVIGADHTELPHI